MPTLNARAHIATLRNVRKARLAAAVARLPKEVAGRPKAAVEGSDLPEGLTVKAAGGGHDPEIYIYDDIGPGWLGMIDGDSVVRALSQLPANHKRVVVRINSPGGDVFEGFSIYNALARHPAEVIVEVDALAASAASVIAMAADEIRMAANAMMMIHRSWTIALGNALDLGHVAEVLGQIDGIMVDTYTARTGQSKDDVQAWVDAETWMTAAVAVERGFADAVGQDLQVSASIPEGRFKNVPERFKDALKPEPRARRQPAEETPPASVAAGVRERIALTRRRLGV